MSLLQVTDLVVTRGEREILRGVSFSASRGEIVALMGLSGGGKTTVMRTVVGLEPFQGGSVDVDGVLLHPKVVPSKDVLRELRRRVGIVFQFHYLFDHLTVLQNVTLAPIHVAGASRAEAERRALELLQSLGVAHRKDARPEALSGGEAQRVAIARAMAMDPPLLLMDEPTASLDPARRAELGETLRALTAEGRTLVITTHDVEFARGFASRVVVLAEGAVVEEGDARDVLSSPQHPATRAFLREEAVSD